MDSLQWSAILFVWLFNLVSFAVQETCKMLVDQAFLYYDSFTALEEQAYAGQFLTDSFLHFTTGYGGKKTIVTRRSVAAAQDTGIAR